jgi:cytochrome c biogenesis protein CcmG/thiol:disulfide interchange protein DsbE
MLWLLPAVIVLGLGGVALFRARPQAELLKPAPGVELPDLRDPDELVSLARFRGEPVILNFWASWCEPCREEAPLLVRAARRYGRRVAFIGVNILDGREEALDYIDEYGIGYLNVADRRATLAKRYGVTGAPETAFIDRQGNLVGKYIGAFRQNQLEDLLDDLLELGPGRALRITGRGETRPVP